MWRRQPPVHSPLTIGALASGLSAALGGRAGAEEEVRRLLRTRYGARLVVFTDSGTSALTLALRGARALGHEQVSFPGFSCYDLGTAWTGAGVQPLLHDLDPAALGPRAPSLRAALDSGAGAVVAAYLYGVPLDWEGLEETLGDYDPLVIEDAAQATGCAWKGREAGSLGDLSVLSFGRGKGRTGGGGGALLALTERGLEAVSRLATERLPPRGTLRPLVQSVAQWILSRPSLYGLPSRLPGLDLGETVYHPPSPAGGISSFSLGALRETTDLETEAAKGRRERASRLLEAVRQADDVSAVEAPAGGTPGYLRLPVLARGRAPDRLTSDRAVRLGVMPSYPRPLHRVPQLANSFGDPRPELSGAEELSRSLFTLPTHDLVSRRGLRELCDIVRGPTSG